MNHVTLVHARLGEAGADPEGLATRSVRNVAEFIGNVHVAFADTIEHREDRTLTGYIDDCTLAALPHHMRRALTAKQQSVTSDFLETHSD